MKKIDLKKELKTLYNPPKEIVVIDVHQMNFLMIDGAGNPNTAQEYKDAIEALYAVSYTLKFMVKKSKDIDYVVMPLEGLWWTDEPDKFSMENKDIWKWIAMIMQPDFVTEVLFDRAAEQVKIKKSLSSLSKIKFKDFYEGLSAQLMYSGPYSAEGPSIEKLHNFIKENGYELSGKHHEIYLSDPRKSAPEKLKTVIRQPVKSIGTFN
ncbi:MAG TPA: GyrI-like domain-containing protein [Candidatus Marinimicrobia bacterium]|nr:GyrI-like domain-containing protein [Candidatus Neomarinimicrobiota bacterium]HRS51437.1 GyrI-like domain-containing protein [Candidatus Neomarinimicrobiota bacterium]